VWKLAEMGFVQPAEDGVHHTTPTEREAGLRSIRADYCGTGKPFTKDGTMIDWEATAGWLWVDGPGEDTEAIWTDAGAMCLTNPRLMSLDYINQFCAPPPCDDYEDHWSSSGPWITRNP
jgi:hypothetical protein